MSRSGTWRHDLEGWLWVNTRWQTPQFLISDEGQLAALIAELQMEKVEFCIFDVFRRIHLADENDNTEMAAVLENLTRVQTEVGCAVGLVHHLSKDVTGSIFRRIRGASATHGWTEWAVGASIANPEAEPKYWKRRLEFETKAAAASEARYFQVSGEGEALRLEKTEPPEYAGPRPVPMAANYLRRKGQSED
jgi:AAA domain